ncbi:MAG TPA: hypothetical protein VKH43_09120, partial [Thermoanaerobaculia bacterium]|nr:hypothetical protein [Thermoanaerobaculia bacterium]
SEFVPSGAGANPHRGRQPMRSNGDRNDQTVESGQIIVPISPGTRLGPYEILASLVAPISKDANIGPYLQHQLVRIYMLTGEPEKALDQLEPLLKIPYFLSSGWLKIDPNFDPLRNNPRFQKLIAAK